VVRLNRSRSLHAPLLWERGVSQVMLSNVVFGLWIILGLSKWAKGPFAGPEHNGYLINIMGDAEAISSSRTKKERVTRCHDGHNHVEVLSKRKKVGGSLRYSVHT